MGRVSRRTIADAAYVWTHFFRNWNFHNISTEQFELRQMPVALLSILVLEAGQWMARRASPETVVGQWPRVLRWTAYFAAVFLVIFFGVFRKTQFIYFQF